MHYTAALNWTHPAMARVSALCYLDVTGSVSCGVLSLACSTAFVVMPATFPATLAVRKHVACYMCTQQHSLELPPPCSHNQLLYAVERCTWAGLCSLALHITRHPCPVHHSQLSSARMTAAADWHLGEHTCHAAPTAVCPAARFSNLHCCC
jgi:hypothetical protein